MIIVITAPSGSGKTTIYRELLRRNRDLVFSVSYTTRKRREDEAEGVDYFFTDGEIFQRKIDRGEFVEWAVVHGELYGTEKRQIIECLERRKKCILDVDVQGALKIMEKYPRAVTIFIEPPGLKELEQRLKKRGTETEDAIRLRLSDARKELEHKHCFQYIVSNERVEDAVQKILEIIHIESTRRNG